MPWTVFNRYGQRKYLTSDEIDDFIKEAKHHDIEVRAFCMMMAFTGCRISEALSLTRNNIDFGAQHIIIKCLKKRGKRVFRAVPLPSSFLKMLKRWVENSRSDDERLWAWSRMTGYRRIREIMEKARIFGSFACPKGLRHGFGVRAIQAGVPLTLVQRWLGHADIKTTAIYTSAMGPEERDIAARMWGRRTPWSKRPPKNAGKEIETDNLYSEELGEPQSGIPSVDQDTISRSTSQFRSPVPRHFVPQHAQESPQPTALYCLLRQFWVQCRTENPSFSFPYLYSPGNSLRADTGR